MNGNIDSLVASMDKLSSSESSPISNQSANDLLIQDETIEKYSTNNNNHKDNIGQDSINDLIKIDPKNRMTTTTTTTNIDSSIGHHPNHNQIIRHHPHNDLNEKNLNHHHHHQQQHRQNDAHHHHPHSTHHQNNQNHKSNVTNHQNQIPSFQIQQHHQQSSQILSQQYPPSSTLPNHPKYKSYKLVSDPALRKGATKLYRYDGTVSSVCSILNLI